MHVSESVRAQTLNWLLSCHTDEQHVLAIPFPCRLSLADLCTQHWNLHFSQDPSGQTAHNLLLLWWLSSCFQLMWQCMNTYDRKLDIKFICLNTSYLCLMAWTIINPDWKYKSLCLQWPVTSSLLAPLRPNSLTMHTVSGSFCAQHCALAEIPGRKPLFLYVHQCGWSPGISLVCHCISHNIRDGTTLPDNFHALTYCSKCHGTCYLSGHNMHPSCHDRSSHTSPVPQRALKELELPLTHNGSGKHQSCSRSVLCW